jgi:hypothetical protein
MKIFNIREKIMILIDSKIIQNECALLIIISTLKQKNKIFQIISKKELIQQQKQMNKIAYYKDNSFIKNLIKLNFKISVKYFVNKQNEISSSIFLFIKH